MSDQDQRTLSDNEVRMMLLMALKGLLADIEDYQRINHLGGEHNQSQVVARAAIRTAESQP